MIAAESLRQRVPRAGPQTRLVAVTIRFRFRGPRAPFDSDAPVKSVMDALVRAKLIVDDGYPWCRGHSAFVEPGDGDDTVITLEDL